MASKKILIISYYWPPSGGVGVQRWMNFALQLKERGWDPVVLTPENPQFEIKDEQLLDRVKEIVVKRVPIWEPFDLFHSLTGQKDRKNVQQGLVLEKSRKSAIDALTVWIRGNLLIPDPRVFWLRKAAKAALELIEQEKVDYMVTTGPPHSMHLIGRRVKRRVNQVKWIADFRDPWSKWDVLKKLNASALALWIHQRLEHSVVQEADHVITVSDRLASSLGAAHVIHNGVTIGSRKSESKPAKDSFTIGYYGLLNELRNPSKLWLILDQMCREDEAFASKLKIRIGGVISESIKSELMKLDQLKDRVSFLGYLPHDSLVNEYSKCDLLLLLLNKSDNSKWILPIKFFEYISARRMMLCLGERNSDLGNLMNNRNVGEILSYSEISQITAFIEDVYENERTPSDEDITALLKQFSHKTSAERLEQILND